MISYLRQKGLRITSFVGDFLLLGSSELISSHSDIFLECLHNLGWNLNLKKCSLTPASTIEYIGFTLDTTQGTPCLRVPHSKIRKVRKDLRRLLGMAQFSARHLAVCLGQCVSMARAIFPAKLLLRNAYRLLATRKDWDSKTLVSDPATRKDLLWWIHSLENWNGIVLKSRPNALQISTDASGSGWGAHLHNLNLDACGQWDWSMKERCSNYREIMAVYLGLKSFAPHIQGCAVTVLSDNVTATAYLNHMGGPRRSMSQVAKAVWALAHQLDISLTVRYLAGKDNVVADRLSRRSDPYEWQLHPHLFRHIDRVFGPHTVDRFASLQSAQLQRYNSALYDPAAEAVDALSQDWTGEMNFVNPPFRLLPKVLRLISNQQVCATVIAPYWPSQTWFRTLLQMSQAPPLRIPNTRRSIRRLSGPPEPLKNHRWKIYAWKLCGKQGYNKMDFPPELQTSCRFVGQTLHDRHTIDSYNVLQSFVQKEALIFH